MSRALQGELLKLRTTRTFLVLVGVAVALSMLVVTLVASTADDITRRDAAALLSFDGSALFVLLLGAIGMTGEWRHRTITSSLLAAPDRIRFVLAKVIAYAVAGALLSLILTLAIAIVAAIVLSARGEEVFDVADLADQLVRNAAVSALLGALGVGIGTVVRNQVAAIIGIFVVLLIVEPAVLSVKPEVGRFGPFTGAPGAISASEQEREDAGTALGDGTELLPGGVAALVMVGWVVLFCGAGTLLLQRRDVV